MALRGGSIDNAGTLTVHNSTISDSFAGRGGGVFNESTGTLVLFGCIVADNGADLGGGIYNEGALTVHNSTITENSLTAGDSGGGIYKCCGGTLTLKHTSVTGNTPNDIVP